MIQAYCRMCGLFLSVPDEYAGGRGACARCHTPLRIPRPVSTDSPDYQDGLRYIASPASDGVRAGDRPALVTPELGESRQYRCSSCQAVFESLEAHDCPQGRCPSCGKVNDRPINVGRFPRRYAGQEGQQEHPDDVYEAAPADDQDLSDSVISGMSLTDMQTADETAPAESPAPSAPVAKPKPQPKPKPAAPKAQAPAKPKPAPGSKPAAKRPVKQEQAARSIPEGTWLYLQRGDEQGPVRTQKIRQLLAAGDISRTTQVWRTGMTGWRTLDSIPELTKGVEAAEASTSGGAPAPAASSEAVSAKRSVQSLILRCQRLLWLSITVLCLVLLLFVASQTFRTSGHMIRIASGAIAALVLLLSLGYGLIPLMGSRGALSRVPQEVRYQGWIGVLLLLLASGSLGAVALAVRHARPGAVQQALQTQEAVSLYRALAEATPETAGATLDLDRLVVNGKNFGAAYGAASTDRRRELVQDLLKTFRLTLDPPIEGEAWHDTGSWVVLQDDASGVLFSRTSTTTGQHIEMRVRGGRIVMLELGVPVFLLAAAV